MKRWLWIWSTLNTHVRSLFSFLEKNNPQKQVHGGALKVKSICHGHWATSSVRFNHAICTTGSALMDIWLQTWLINSHRWSPLIQLYTKNQLSPECKSYLEVHGGHWIALYCPLATHHLIIIDHHHN